MVHELAQRHGFRVGRQLGDVLADAVVEREPAVAGEQQQGKGGELLRGRGDIEDGVGVDGGAALDIGEAIAGGMDERAVADDTDGAARLHALCEALEEGVDGREAWGHGATGLEFGADECADGGGQRHGEGTPEGDARRRPPLVGAAGPRADGAERRQSRERDTW